MFGGTLFKRVMKRVALHQKISNPQHQVTLDLLKAVSERQETLIARWDAWTGSGAPPDVAGTAVDPDDYVLPAVIQKLT